MSWRTIVVANRCKLDLKMEYMVIRGEETKRIFLDEVAILLIETPAVSLTGCLLEALTERKIRVIFCDKARAPMAELTPYYGCHDTTRKLRQQAGWSEETKGVVWSEIVRDKIQKQAEHLADRGKHSQALLLQSYLPEIEFNDAGNREGHAAKVYFNALFGREFIRRDESPANAALDYGYTILLSAFSREVAAAGYLTQWGLHHDNVFNHFNLSSDLMEPFRILVDRAVYTMMPTALDKQTRYRLVDLLNDSVEIANTKQTVLNAIRIYAKGVFTALNENDPGCLRFYRI